MSLELSTTANSGGIRSTRCDDDDDEVVVEEEAEAEAEDEWIGSQTRAGRLRFIVRSSATSLDVFSSLPC